MKSMKHCLFAALMSTSISGLAATVDMSFSPQDQTLGFNVGGSVDIVGTYNADAVELLLGGALDLSYDETIINVTSVSITAPTDIDSDNGTIDNNAGTVDRMGFATFAGVAGGNFKFATVNFDTVGLGKTLLQLTDSNDLVFRWVNENLSAVGVNTVDGSVTVVPLPAAVWLMLSGLAGLTAVGKRRTSGQTLIAR
jgi:hypothetical protein